MQYIKRGTIYDKRIVQEFLTKYNLILPKIPNSKLQYHSVFFILPYQDSVFRLEPSFFPKRPEPLSHRNMPENREISFTQENGG